MEKRTKLKFEEQNEVFFEAVFVRDGYSKKTVTESSLESLQSAIKIWTKCGEWKLESADKVERVICQLIA